jgi:Holliday junction DNA helicase RuvB
MQANDVLFIDEIHRLPTAVEEYIYPAMEDFRIDFTVDSGMHSKVVTIGLRPFTLIGATTRAGLLTQALRTRFGISHNLGYYPVDELMTIVARAARLLGMPELPAPTLRAVSERSRGTPRVALRLLRRVRDFSQVRAGGSLASRVVDDALALEGVDALGLDELDRRYMRTLATTYGGGPAGIEAIAASVGEDSQTLEDVVEPFLLQAGFLARTRQGRRLTDAAFRHLGIDPPPREGALYE